MKYQQWIVTKPMEGGVLRLDQFEQREADLPDLMKGQALVRIKLLNIHSGTRSRIARGVTIVGTTDRTNYACAEVIKSHDDTFQEGDIIACQSGWQTYQIISSADESIGYGPASESVKALNRTNSQWVYVFRPHMAKAWAPEVLMDIFGTSGMTAYFGMRECGPVTSCDAVAVAAASGSVGSLVAQLAKNCKAYVVGFAGGHDRCDWVRSTLGIDGCIDYRAGDFEAQLAVAFPHGLDMFSDGVGGQLTETVVGLMSPDSRLFAYGSAAAFYGDRSDALGSDRTLRQAFGISDNVERMLTSRNIRSSAWIVDRFYQDRITAEDELSKLLESRVLRPISNVVDGFENLPHAVVQLYESSRAGKLQVRF
jgi:NADPH-dependent curcumin reductase CurA